MSLWLSCCLCGGGGCRDNISVPLLSLIKISDHYGGQGRNNVVFEQHV